MTALAAARPPVRTAGPLQWARENLFSTWYNAILTVLSLVVIYLVLSSSLRWALTSARWEAVTVNLRLFMVGRFPVSEQWRVWTGLYLLSLLAGAGWGAWGGFLRSVSVALGAGLVTLALLPFALDDRLLLAGNLPVILGAALLARRLQRPGWVLAVWFLAPVVYYLILSGQLLPGLRYLGPVTWEGLLLTMMLTITGIVVSFPIGVLLALGRQSKLPIVKGISTAYIELIRGVPLITILFMSQIMLPLFLPPGMLRDRVVRALIGVILFAAAYQAENVRGGLQAVGEGQREAARSLGLNPILITLFIVLPQALRAVIPALVGQFISLFKDTSLVAIVGLLDLLNIANFVTKQPQFLRLFEEVFLFVAFIYWIVSYTMSIGSRRLEKALGLGER